MLNNKLNQLRKKRKRRITTKQ